MSDLQDKLVDSLDKCGWIDNVVRLSNINEQINELEHKARLEKSISNASRNAPLTEFLSPEESNRLNDLRRQKQIVQESINTSVKCATDSWEKEVRQEGASLEDILDALGFKIDTIKDIKVVNKK